MWIMPLQKQSQFVLSARSVPVRASKKRVAGLGSQTRNLAFGVPFQPAENAARMAATQTPHGVTTSRTRCAKQSQFPGTRVSANLR